jgi:hypothetical protein
VTLQKDEKRQCKITEEDDTNSLVETSFTSEFLLWKIYDISGKLTFGMVSMWSYFTCVEYILA